MTWEEFLAIAGAIVLISNAGVAIYKWIRPALQMKKTVESMDVRITALEEHEKNDYEALKHMMEMSKLLCQGMICILNHMVDGNGVDKMKETREDMQDLLIKI